MSSDQEARKFGETAMGAVVLLIIVLGLISMYWQWIVGALIVGAAVGISWTIVRRRTRLAETASQGPAEGLQKGASEVQPWVVAPVAAHQLASSYCACDGPPHPHSTEWCLPDAPAVTSTSRSFEDAVRDAREWAVRLESDSAHSAGEARAKLFRQAQLLTYLISRVD